MFIFVRYRVFKLLMHCLHTLPSPVLSVGFGLFAYRRGPNKEKSEQGSGGIVLGGCDPEWAKRI